MGGSPAKWLASSPQSIIVLHFGPSAARAAAHSPSHIGPDLHSLSLAVRGAHLSGLLHGLLAFMNHTSQPDSLAKLAGMSASRGRPKLLLSGARATRIWRPTIRAEDKAVQAEQSGRGRARKWKYNLKHGPLGAAGGRVWGLLEPFELEGKQRETEINITSQKHIAQCIQASGQPRSSPQAGRSSSSILITSPAVWPALSSASVLFLRWTGGG